MSIALQKAAGKPTKPIRYTPSREESQYIRYRLRLAGKTFAQISRQLGLSDSCTYKVVYGKRRSARIEAEIARILGKDSWNDVVLEARSEIQKKPIEVILQEREQRLLELRDSQKRKMERAIANSLPKRGRQPRKKVTGGRG